MGGEVRVAGLSVRICVMRDCLTHIPLPRLFCERHWKLITPRLQEEIAAAWADNDIEELEELLLRARNAVTTIERRRRGGS